MNYRIIYASAFLKSLEKISKRDTQKILKKVKLLSENPNPSGSKKLKGHDLFRLRVGDYRVIYNLKDEQLTVIVLKAGHRKNIYRDLS